MLEDRNTGLRCTRRAARTDAVSQELFGGFDAQQHEVTTGGERDTFSLLAPFGLEEGSVKDHVVSGAEYGGGKLEQASVGRIARIRGVDAGGRRAFPEEVVEVSPPMNMQDDVFIAPEAEPLQEARAMHDFKNEQHLQDIHFEYDRDVLDSQTKSILRANADWLKKNPNARVEIQGHADERGTNNYNLGLGERRALQTKKYMVRLGIDESRLYTISYGEEKPFCFDSNENCWWENRRAHFTVAE